MIPRSQDGHTNHVKQVPGDTAVREAIRRAAESRAHTLNKSCPISKSDLVRTGRALLTDIGQPEKYLGYAMVQIGNCFWKEQFLATPFEQRLLLLPRHLEHVPECRSEDPRHSRTSCAACSLEDDRIRAEQLGYQIISADRSSLVLNQIVEGSVDAILGVARMDVLEKAFGNVVIAGVPSFVVPLCSDQVPPGDAAGGQSWLAEVLERFEPPPPQRTMSFVPLMRASCRLFTDEFPRLLPRTRSRTPAGAASPLGITEEVAYDWLANGGKRFRPFITLAAYHAVTAVENRIDQPGLAGQCRFPDSVCRVAMAIEAFHKASLVHDDIQDDDQFRYGRETLHRSHGVGPAINIGDYLIGHGYRLVNSCRDDLGADVAAEIVHSMADAHIKLCDGQGAEMAWQLDPDWSLQPADALQIYELKTSPAFEAALHAGLRMAGPVDQYAELVPLFARHLGVGFQVLNDLKDWQGDADNKLIAGQDALAVRPTVLLALALDAASDAQRIELQEIYQTRGNDPLRLHQLLRLFTELGAFDRAVAIVNEARDQAMHLTQDIRPPALKRLLRFLVETVLSQETQTLRSTAQPPQPARRQPVAGT